MICYIIEVSRQGINEQFLRGNFGPKPARMVITDGLVPVRCQDIHNNHDDQNLLSAYQHIGKIPGTHTPLWAIVTSTHIDTN